jgi:outer membrane lipoprotein SlyB
MYDILRKALLLAGVSLLLSACVGYERQDRGYNSQAGYASSDRDYARNDDDRRRDDRYSPRRCDSCGTVEAIHEDWERERASGGGAVLGAILGGVVGNQVGSGSGRRAATVAGAVIGGVAGNEVERRRGDEQRVYRFEVRMDNGQWAEVTQREQRGLRIGDRVDLRQQQLYAID